MADAPLVEQLDGPIEVGPRRHTEAEVIEADPERVEAVAGRSPIGVGRTEPEEHPLVHQDDAALQRFDDLVVRSRRPGGGGPSTATSNPSTLGVEGLRSLDVGDGHPQVVNGSDR